MNSGRREGKKKKRMSPACRLGRYGDTEQSTHHRLFILVCVCVCVLFTWNSFHSFRRSQRSLDKVHNKKGQRVVNVTQRWRENLSAHRIANGKKKKKTRCRRAPPFECAAVLCRRQHNNGAASVNFFFFFFTIISFTREVVFFFHFRERYENDQKVLYYY